MTLAAGTKIDIYEILGPLGAGGMGEVYRARDSVLKRDLAIKVLPSFVSQDPERLRRFQQEAQATAALNHPNIVAIYRLGTFEGAPYIASELLEGGTLGQQLAHGPLPVRKAIDYAVQIARDWNARARGADSGADYVTRFRVRTDFILRYPVQTVGDSIHQCYHSASNALPSSQSYERIRQTLSSQRDFSIFLPEISQH